ncbi:V-type proton ATPase 116 kDa subunit a 1 isoform X1 [Plutella xylostella]|uniref:V-type proton ATPase 116 kDa subunit a 1 isoform X1 n=2 Tax=Plutella xylostella TaxID=51655 RepID=UPI0020331968|nr:V-type proton ATPase 116 kDa subunit a 1 isoform X1 [Plutella xylostella]XP_048478923.1 V-type proton ATPase 116 kDa subunit a 1 isoform X1 [Plutella xylostella]
MGAMFRSEEMVLCQLFIQSEAAYVSMYELGEAGVAQFRDLNPHVNDFQRRYVTEVRRCSEMERKLRWVAGELPEPPPPPQKQHQTLSPREINILEERIDFIESEIQEITRNAQNLKTDYLSLIELKLLIEKMQTFFQDHSAQRRISASVQVATTTEGGIAHLGFIAGVVATHRVASFEKMLWRISHGNIFFKQAQIDEPLKDPVTGHELMKTVFVVFFHGEQIKLRVKKVCHGFQATLYPCPAMYKEQQDMLGGVISRIKDLEIVLDQTEQHRRLVLTNIARDISTWMVLVRKEKAIYHTLNMFSMDIVKKCLIAECWVPRKDLHIVQQALDNGVKASGSPIPSILHYVPTREVPPTFNRTNKFTSGFQNLIDSYGIASYREVNPALYTIITFPFLFAVMFGDVGHGLLMTIFGLVLVIFEKKFLKVKTDNEIWNIFFGGRYIILLMGLFSIYTGFIYNDFFSKSLNIFGSSWRNVYDEESLKSSQYRSLDPRDSYTGTPYPFGMDPVWQFAENNIIFTNSFKMKLSIIFGVLHMAFGVTMSVVNFNFFRRPEMIFLQYIPQIVFLLLLFWYLCIMMFMKWTMYSSVSTDPVYGSSCAPQILILFINMMLLKKTESKDGPPCQGYIYAGQDELQKTFLVLAFLCIPVILFGKPVYQIMSDKKRRKYQQGVESPESAEPPEPAGESLGELLITQAIHTIEYILGTVSHTASYLRLWALSLAHSQLSAVLWKQIMKQGLGAGSFVNAITLYVIFAAWAFFTLAILVLMEGLSAFLHTLRLHWVEFMSKFYEGQGYAFAPFSFSAMLEHDEDIVVESNGGPAE